MADKHAQKKNGSEHSEASIVTLEHLQVIRKHRPRHLDNNHAVRLGKDCDYERELRRLQVELVKLQEWIRHEGLARGGHF